MLCLLPFFGGFGSGGLGVGGGVGSGWLSFAAILSVVDVATGVLFRDSATSPRSDSPPRISLSLIFGEGDPLGFTALDGKPRMRRYL